MRYGIVDELIVVGLHLMQAFLNDMVPIEVLNEGNHIALKRLPNDPKLLGEFEDLNQPLNSSSAMHILGNIDEGDATATNNRKSKMSVWTWEKTDLCSADTFSMSF